MKMGLFFKKVILSSGLSNALRRNFCVSGTRSEKQSSVRIACASGFWGDTATAVPQLVYGAKNLDFLV